MRIGAACLVSTILYIIPRTAALGAILLIGYLGGRRRATHVRVEAEKFTFLVPFVFATNIINQPTEPTMQLNPCLSFNGQCEAAFKFYEKCLKIGQLLPIFGDENLI